VYEMLVGMPPFTGPNVQALLARHSMDFVSPPSIVRDTIPETMETALLRALAKVPADRFPTVIMFAEALAAPSTITAAMRRKTGMTPLPFARQAVWQRRLRWGVPALLLLALAAWGASRLLSPRRGPSFAPGGLDPSHIAVRYFDDLSRDSSQGYLADGLTEALIGQLGSVSALQVISKNGVAPYRGSTLARDSIARALKVGSIIEGSVEPVGDSIQVSVRLIEGASGDAIERRSFRVARGDLLQSRDRLATQVTEFLRSRLGQEVRLRQLRAGTASTPAWLLTQQAEKARKDAEGLLQTDESAATRRFLAADSLLVAAEAIDPQWIEPIVQRGQIAYRQSRLTQDLAVAAPLINTGLAHAERALALDSRHPPALELRGSLRYWKWLIGGVTDPRDAETLLRDAEKDLRDAVQLDPSLAGAWSTLSHLDYQRSDYAAAKIDATQAYRADAYYSAADGILWRLFTSSYDIEAFTDAQHWCEEGYRRFPDNKRFSECWLWMLTTRVTPANPVIVDSAWRLVEEIQKRTSPEDRQLSKLTAQMAVAAVLARAGLVDSARHLAVQSRASTEVDQAQDLLYFEAFVRTLLGDKDEALKLLQRYLAGNEERRADVAGDYQWWFRDLRTDPRWQQLVSGR